MKKLQLFLVLFFSCVCAVSAQHFEWRYMNSNLTAFAQKPGSPDVVFAGDAAGLIRRSDDRGATWKLISMESEAAITSIAFLDANKGFAATSVAGLILITTDGGATWARKQFVDAENPEQPYSYHAISRIIVVDENTAFFDIYNHPISAGTLPETIVTRDGGATFRVEFAPGDIFHAGNGTMIATGKEPDMFGIARFTVYKSTDKGVTWNIVKISPEGLNNDFNFHGVNLGVFMSADEFYLTANKQLAGDGNIYKTTDGGNSFAPLAGFPKTKADYLYFKNSMEGFAITGNVGGKATFVTADGGTTWEPADKNMQSVAQYLGNNTFIAFYNDHTAISTDFGRSWTEQADPINSLRGSMGSPGLHSLFVVNDSVAFASVGSLSSGVYYGRDLMRTTDGGLTWKAVLDAAGTSYKGETYHFVSKDTFFFIGTGFNETGTQGGYMKIKYTTDGGLTSKEIFTGNWWEEVREFVFIDKDNAATYSFNSASINYSTDGGQSWTNTTTSGKITGEITKVLFPHIDSWYARTTDGQTFRSTDRGQSWVDITGDFSCGTIHFTDATTGYSFGCRKKLHKTTDGGQNWIDLSSGLDPKIENNQPSTMSFRTATEGYMADPYANGTYLAISTDNGNNWGPYTKSQLAARITKIDFSDENTGAMMDLFGNFARYIGPTVVNTDTIKLSADVVGVGEQPTQGSISLYPNPAGDFIVVGTAGVPVHSIEIRDIMGRVHIRIDGGMQTTHKIATTDLAAGTYIVTVSTGKHFFSQRLSIVR